MSDKSKPTVLLPHQIEDRLQAIRGKVCVVEDVYMRGIEMGGTWSGEANDCLQVAMVNLFGEIHAGLVEIQAAVKGGCHE